MINFTIRLLKDFNVTLKSAMKVTLEGVTATDI